MADPTDPRGYAQTLATIPSDALSTRQQRVAAAVALVRVEGRTVSQASRETGIPRPTIYRHLDGVSSIADTSKGDQAAHRRILDASQAIAIRAGDAVLDAIEDGGMRPGDLIKAYGVATDKTIALGAQRSEGERGVSALAELLSGGGSVTIQAPTPEERAVEGDGRRVDE